MQKKLADCSNYLKITRLNSMRQINISSHRSMTSIRNININNMQECLLLCSCLMLLACFWQLKVPFSICCWCHWGVLVNMENVVHFYREQGKSRKRSYWQATHCMLGIYHFTPLRSKYMNCSIELVTSNALLWALINSKKHLVVFVLLSILFAESVFCWVFNAVKRWFQCSWCWLLWACPNQLMKTKLLVQPCVNGEALPPENCKLVLINKMSQLITFSWLTPAVL